MAQCRSGCGVAVAWVDASPCAIQDLGADRERGRTPECCWLGSQALGLFGQGFLSTITPAQAACLVSPRERPARRARWRAPPRYPRPERVLLSPDLERQAARARPAVGSLGARGAAGRPSDPVYRLGHSWRLRPTVPAGHPGPHCSVSCFGCELTWSPAARAGSRAVSGPPPPLGVRTGRTHATTAGWGPVPAEPGGWELLLDAHCRFSRPHRVRGRLLTGPSVVPSAPLCGLDRTLTGFLTAGDNRERGPMPGSSPVPGPCGRRS